jgi:hypothetical protein
MTSIVHNHTAIIITSIGAFFFLIVFLFIVFGFFTSNRGPSKYRID